MAGSFLHVKTLAAIEWLYLYESVQTTSVMTLKAEHTWYILRMIASECPFLAYFCAIFSFIAQHKNI